MRVAKASANSAYFLGSRPSLRSGVLAALRASGEQIVCARDDVREKALGTGESSLLPSDSGQMVCDDFGSFGLVSMKYQANVGQADSHVLTGPQHPQSTQVFLAVIAVTRRETFGHNHTDVLPMSEDVSRNVEFARSLSDPHSPMVSH